ncbi:MAG: HEAT repeat domain-containing protein [Bryobacteraceae bacterium]|jgi:HEAT repeat protein
MRLLTILLAVSLSAFAHSDSEVKLKFKAIKDTARQGSTGIPAIAGYLQDQSAEVRREAVKAIVGIGGLASLDPLVVACRDNDSEVQQRATDGLINFYLPGYVGKGWTESVKHVGSAISSVFSQPNDRAIDPDTPVRPEIVEALSRLIRNASSFEARANAARAAGILRARAAVPALSEALKSKDDVLMFESLVAMQKIRDTSAGPSAIFLVRDLNEKLQLAAIETVGVLRTTEAVPDLKRVLETGGKKARPAALAALGQIADPSTRPIFAQFLNDKDDRMRASAAEGLARVGLPEDRPPLEKLFQAEKKTSLRISMAFALVGLGDIDMATDGPLRYLASNLSTRSWRGVAEPFLAEQARKPQVRQAIHQMLKDLGDKDELMGLARALAVSGGKDSIPPLEELSRHPDPEVSKEALRALRLVNSRS